MSNSRLLNGSSGFRFIRPTIGRIGNTDILHPHVGKAMDELVTRLEAGLPAPPVRAREQVEELEAEAAATERKAADAQIRLKRAARALDEAYKEHRKAEDIADRRTAEYNEALDHAGRQQGGDEKDRPEAAARTATTEANGPDLETLRKNRDTAREAAEKAAEALPGIKDKADQSGRDYSSARRHATEAADKARDARRRLTQSRKAVADLLALPLYSRDPKVATLLSTPPGAGDVGLDKLADRFGYTAELYEVRRLIGMNGRRLSFNLRNLLSRTEVVDYLFLRAILADGVEEPEGIFNSIVDEDRGGALLYNYAAERALVITRDERRLSIPDATMTAMVERLAETPVSLRRDQFDTTLRELEAEFVYGDAELGLVLEAERVLGIDIPAQLQPALVDYIRRTNAGGQQINKQNAPYFISIALSRLQKEEVALRPRATHGDEVGLDDYSVSYYEDRITAPEYERASVEAAAQMYLTMVWGDMLGVFAAVDRIAMQTAADGQAPILLEVRSRQLSDALRMYVLDEEFVDLKTGRKSRRVSPVERQMFYRQLFGLGDAQVVEDQHVNPDFQRYWAVLMMEVVKYIGKVEESGENFSSISASKVYQAIEDLQYNLSAYCTGLPKIAAPTVYAELDFVIRCILDSDDVKQQLGRRGAPSFWKVVEQVRGMQDFTPLRNKGMFGHKIISTIARATPALVEDQAAFEEFIASVEAFIVAEDQLAEAGGSMAGLQFPGFFGFDGQGAGSLPGMPAGLPGMPSGLPGMPGGMFGAPPGTGNASSPRRGNGAAPSNDWNF